MCYIATGPYISFFERYRYTAMENFLVDCDKHLYVWSDTEVEEREDTTYTFKEWKPWPDAAKYRYRTMLEREEELAEYDVVTMTNANTFFKSPSVLDDIMPDGYSLFGVCQWFSWGVSPEDRRKTMEGVYYSNIPGSKGYCTVDELCNSKAGWMLGGFQGGRSADWLEACRVMTEWQHEDDLAGRCPKWPDEIYWNRWTMDRGANVLNPYEWLDVYCSGGKMCLVSKDQVFGRSDFRTRPRDSMPLLGRLGLLG